MSLHCNVFIYFLKVLMKILSTNISNIKTIEFNGKKVKTGIFKKEVLEPIYLNYEDVNNDNVVDRKHHGGKDKACYLYSFNHYKYWQELYPNLNFEYGMFGENLTVENLDETKIFIGDVFKIGEAIVEVSQSREPCYKLGVKFGTQNIVKQFYNSNFCGVYLRILQKGFVGKNEKMELIKHKEKLVSIAEEFSVFTRNKNDKKINY